MIGTFLHATLATLLILGFYGAFLVVARLITRERSEPRTNLPGSLGRDDTWPVLDEWDEHCRTTPGLVNWAAFEADVRGEVS